VYSENWFLKKTETEMTFCKISQKRQNGKQIEPKIKYADFIRPQYESIRGAFA
jgi:hypothetical protein